MKCFQDHDRDTHELNTHAMPLSECETLLVERNGKTVRVTEVPILTGEGLWRIYQKEAEEIVAPGGTLIADPKERNRAINAAYARLWLHDRRFQWAGLAAFASKQVGCGLLHAADLVEKIQADFDARQRLVESAEPNPALPGVGFIRKFDEQAYREFEQVRENNPMTYLDIKLDGDELSLVQEQFQHVYEMMALGNTTLFLDVFPLHAFYAKRGLEEFKACLDMRKNIYGHPKFPVLWPIGQEKLRFGIGHKQTVQAFEAIEMDNIEKSVEFLADHEQRNILQPAMYSDRKLVKAIRRNQVLYVVNLPSGVPQAIELTLASQCRPLDDGRTISFGKMARADLADIKQRMPFVLNAAKRFDELLYSDGINHLLIEQAIKDIAAGVGVR